MLRYTDDPMEAGGEACLVCHKITGDVNIPRGELSFWAFMGDGQGKQTFGPADMYSTIASSEFKSASVFSGKGRVALMGYRNPQTIDCDVLILSPTLIAVYWHSIGCIVQFKKIPN